MSKQETTNKQNQDATNGKKEDEKKASFSKRLAEGANNFKDVSASLKSINENLGNPINKLSSLFAKKKDVAMPKEEKPNNSFIEDNASNLSADESVLSTAITLKEDVNEDPSKEVVRTNEDPFAQLEGVLNPINIGEQHDKALTKAIESQLKILAVIKTPTLLGQTYNLILSAINDSITLAQTKEEKENYQRNAGLMLHSLVFFQEAQLSYEENNHNKESEQLLDMAVNELQESVTSVALCAITGGGAVAAKKIATKIVIEKACTGIKDSNFIKHFFKYLFKKKQLEQQRKEFYHFLIIAFDKLNRYHDNFGDNQLLLAEMINDYRDKLIVDAEDKTQEIKLLEKRNKDILMNMPTPPLKPGNGGPAKKIVILITIIAMAGIDWYLIRNFYDQSPILVTLASIFVCFVMIVMNIGMSWSISRNVKKNKKEYECKMIDYRKNLADYYYRMLAESFNRSGSL